MTIRLIMAGRLSYLTRIQSKVRAQSKLHDFTFRLFLDGVNWVGKFLLSFSTLRSYRLSMFRFSIQAVDQFEDFSFPCDSM